LAPAWLLPATALSALSIDELDANLVLELPDGLTCGRLGNMMGRGPQLDSRAVNGGQFAQVGPGDGGIDLKGQPRLPAGGDAGQGSLIGPGYGPEAVVAGGRGSIQGDAQPLHSRRLEAAGEVRSQQGAVRCCRSRLGGV
jgi:hypothetical protein